MNGQIAATLKSSFCREVRKRLPEFEAHATGKFDVLSFRVSAMLVFFIHLSVDDGRDSFVVEVACNNVNAYPWKQLPGQVRDLATAQEREVWRFRISKLWGESRDYRWMFEPGLDHAAKINHINAKVADVVDKVCNYAAPYFESAAVKRGYDVRIRCGSSGSEGRVTVQ
jgi:hypothetical protein